MREFLIPTVLVAAILVQGCQSPSGNQPTIQVPTTPDAATVVGSWTGESYTIKDGVDYVSNDDGVISKGYDLISNQTSTISDISVEFKKDGTGTYSMYTTIANYGALEGLLPAELDERNYERNGSTPPRWFAILQFEWVATDSGLTIRGVNGSPLSLSVSFNAQRVGDISKSINYASTHDLSQALKGPWKNRVEDDWGSVRSISGDYAVNGTELTTKLFSMLDKVLTFHRQ